jgi:hypothetical protein
VEAKKFFYFYDLENYETFSDDDFFCLGGDIFQKIGNKKSPNFLRKFIGKLWFPDIKLFPKKKLN